MTGCELICPACSGHFTCDVGINELPERLVCPECEVELPVSDFKLSYFCPECKSRVRLPLAGKDSGGLCCPECRSVPEELKSPAAPPQFAPGTIFDKYRIISRIGIGGMSEVYKAEHLLLKNIYALKILKINSSSSRFAPMYKRFIREGKFFHDLEHPNIVRVFDIGCDSRTGTLFIAMEYLPGGSLAVGKDKPMPERELLNVALHIGRALAKLEEAHIVHRDVKPRNIMCDSSGQYKLMDLGIAKDEGCDPMNYTLTIDQSIFGTPVYSSPEQCESPHNVDHRSDIYSLGAALYHLACGVPPFAGDTPVSVIVNVFNTTPLPPHKVNPRISRAFSALIMRMMAKSPVARPVDAAALLREVEYLQNPEGRRSCRRSETLRIIVAIAVAAAAVTGGVILFKCFHLEKSPVQQKKILSITDHLQEKFTVFLRGLPVSPDISSWKPPPTYHWHIHLRTALREAAGENRPVLAFFCGEAASGYEPGDLEYISRLSKKYILLRVENAVPEMPESQRRYIEAFRRCVQSGGAVPRFIIISPDGKIRRITSGKPD